VHRRLGGSVTREAAGGVFEPEGKSPYMRFVVPVREAWRDRLGAVMHDGMCRVQTVTPASDPVFHALLAAFGRESGVPVLLNTSFDDRYEPIVCTAEDARRSFLREDLDTLVLGPWIVRRVTAGRDVERAARSPRPVIR